jgi:hypothetical protein
MSLRATFELGGRPANALDLYELAVQTPDVQARFLRAVHGGSPRVLGEDFSGPAGIARAWLRLDAEHTAIAVDRDPLPLEHAAFRQREADLASPLTITTKPGIDRLTLRVRDVLEASDKADIIAALNFAVCELHTRARLMTYLRHLLFRLDRGSVFVADLYGGPDAYTPGVAERAMPLPEGWGGGRLVYRWEQVWADPTTARVRNAIHFVLPDGTRLDNAFVYHWRLWQTAELREAMLEAGFRSAEVYSSYGGAVDDEGNLYPEPISVVFPPAADPADPEDPDDRPPGDEPFVHYIVGRA